MKLGLSMYSYNAAYQQGRIDIPNFIQEAKRLDVQGVELLDFYWRDPATELPEVKAALQDTGLPVGVYAVANNFVNVSEAARVAEVKKITDGVDYAAVFGAKAQNAVNPGPNSVVHHHLLASHKHAAANDAACRQRVEHGL